MNTIENIQSLLNDNEIKILGLREHSKASEKYVDVRIIQSDGFYWEGSIPYFYRRTGLFIETPKDIAAYLIDIYPLFTKESIDKFVKTEEERWSTGELAGKGITKGFFDKLINLKWNSVKYDLPSNPNWARRVQDIKEFGYTLATDTNKLVAGKGENDTHLVLIPLPKGGVTGYEIMSPAFKSKAIAVLNSINAYELSSANKHGLIPDHKFPEIRWDDETKAENPNTMSNDEIKDKFQLLDNQRNQQKREVCRKCFQSGKRGIIYGLNYFYSGELDWPIQVPRVGKDAEKGCIGCGWYDINEWRNSLNSLLKK